MNNNLQFGSPLGVYNLQKSKRKFLHSTLYILHSSLHGAGFTLIEILISIAVITFILAVMFPNFMGIRQRARDAQRKSDLSQIQRALELYKIDQNPQAYPTGALGESLCNNCWSSNANCTGNIYMRKFPCDPEKLTPTPYFYSQGSDSLTYSLYACLENLVDPDRDPTPMPTCSTASKASYTVHEP